MGFSFTAWAALRKNTYYLVSFVDKKN